MLCLLSPSLSRLPARPTGSISTLPSSLNNPCFRPPFAPTSHPFSVLLQTVIGNSASNVKYILTCISLSLPDWLHWFPFEFCFFVCHALLLLSSISPEQFLVTPYKFWFTSCGEYKWPEHVRLSDSTQVALMGLCTNPWLIYAAMHEMCSERNLEGIHWLYMFFQSCWVPTSGVAGSGCPDRLIRQQFAFLPQSIYLVHVSRK